MSAQPVEQLLSRSPDRQRIESLLARGWSLPSVRQHPLGRLQGRVLGPAKLLLLLGPKNNVGARYFRLYLMDATGRLGHQPLAEGLHNSGPFPALNWLELIRYNPRVEFDSEELELAAHGLDRRLFSLLGRLLPPGGHLMVEYESPSHKATERILGLGYPPAASPLGALLLAAGCLSFRDWYIAEGGREGPRKLQGFEPPDDRAARQQAQEIAAELRHLLASPANPAHGPWGEMARRLAARALPALEKEQGTGNKEQRSASFPVP